MGYDKLMENNFSKYEILSDDKPGQNPHVPSLTCLCVVTLKGKSPNQPFRNEKEYAECYKGMLGNSDLVTYLKTLTASLGERVILNGYEGFILKSVRLAVEK